MDDLAEDDAVVAITSLVVLGLGLTALFLGYSWFWMVFVIGFAVLVPLVKVASDARGRGRTDDDRPPAERETAASPTDSVGEAGEDEPGSKRDALETLRRRYAEGELSDEEFERKLENLLETETLEDVRETVREERGPGGDSRPDLEDHER